MAITPTIKKYIGTASDSLYDIFRQATGIADLQAESQPEVGARNEYTTAYKGSLPPKTTVNGFPIWILGAVLLFVLYGKRLRF